MYLGNNFGLKEANQRLLKEFRCEMMKVGTKVKTSGTEKKMAEKEATEYELRMLGVILEE